MLCCNRSCWKGPLAQSVERGADNAKVVSSRLTWTTFFSLDTHYRPTSESTMYIVYVYIICVIYIHVHVHFEVRVRMYYEQCSCTDMHVHVHVHLWIMSCM